MSTRDSQARPRLEGGGWRSIAGRGRLAVVCVVVFGGLPLSASPALAADSLTAPTPLAYGTPQTADTSSFTTETNEQNTIAPFAQHCGSAHAVGVARTAWYTIVGTGGQATVTTAGSGLTDTALFIYSGSPTGVLVVCNDDISASVFQSSVSFPTVAGVTYAIQAGSFCGDTPTCSSAPGGLLQVSASSASPPPPPPAPVNTSLPTISGTARQGQRLTESRGAWTNSPTGFTYQWKDCDSSGNVCSAIAHATAQTYTLAAHDVGHTIRVTETASNAGGAGVAATSAPLAVVLPPLSRSQIKKLLGSLIPPGGKLAKIPALLRNGLYSLSFNAPGPGKLTIAWYVVPRGAHIAKVKPKPVLVAIGKLTVSRAGKALIKIKLTAHGKKLLKHARSLKLTGKGSFTPTGHPVVTTTKTFTIRR